jgi:hypothetical protein
MDWFKILVTEKGKEFEKWLKKKHKIIYFETMTDTIGVLGVQFFKYEKSAYGENLPENIINNLAVEWLDSKKVYITLNKSSNWSVNINEDFGVLNIYHGIPNFGTRQEAIVTGVKKAFELLENNYETEN